jgi:hypothetical protein
MSTPKSRPRQPTPPKTPPLLLASQLHPPELLAVFCRFLPLRQIRSWLPGRPRGFYQRAYTPLIVLWYLVFQRLADNHHLSHVVADARDGGADRLSPRGKRLSRVLRSESTSAYSDARQSLPLPVVAQALRHIVDTASANLQIPRWFGLRVGLLDGSTLRLRPNGDIPRAFPPHRPGNCHKSPYWCVARVVGLFCQATGLLMGSAVGSLKDSEQTLSALLLQGGWKDWLLVADRNFGVYSMARAAVAARAHLLARLTEARAKKLAALAHRKLVPGLDVPLEWEPSRDDQCPAGLDRQLVKGRLVVVRLRRAGFRVLTLYLFTTLTDAQVHSAKELVQLYGQRWQVELCFRYVKTQMDLGFLECNSAAMARKEWLAGLIAYNLIRWVMASAAATAKVPVQQLSFSRARELLLGWFLRHGEHRPSLPSWKRLLSRIAKCLQPKRRKPRPPEPRATRPLRPPFPPLITSRAKARQQLAKTNANS